MWYGWNCILINSSGQFCQDLFLLCERTIYFKISSCLLAAKLHVNTLAPGKCGFYFKNIILKLISGIDILGVSNKILSGEYHRTQVMISQHWLRWWPLPEPMLTQISVFILSPKIVPLPWTLTGGSSVPAVEPYMYVQFHSNNQRNLSPT